MTAPPLPPYRSRRGGQNLTTGGPDGQSPVVRARLTADTHTRLAAVCEQRGISVSHAVREAIATWLDAQSPPPQLT